MELPPEYLGGTVAQLLDRVFPSDEDSRQEIAGRFDLRANPDLPEIYGVLLAVCEEWRDWRCALSVVSVDGAGVDLNAAASRLVLPSSEDLPLLSLRMEQEYHALEYAARHGFWAERAELLAWLRSLTTIYFLDKHDVSPDAAGVSTGTPPDIASGLSRALRSLQSQGLIAPQDLADDPDVGAASGEPLTFAITPEGRSFIRELLTETESYIDLYDHYQDTAIDLDGELVEFGTGRGVDLRVEAFMAEGLDPIRTVFLLRLYDGTLDARLRDWAEVIESEDFYEAVLEPVVNRDGADPAAMELAIEHGYSWLEERQEQARREETQREILRRADGGTP